jgi:hypothetical protein
MYAAVVEYEIAYVQAVIVPEMSDDCVDIFEGLAEAESADVAQAEGIFEHA